MFSQRSRSHLDGCCHIRSRNNRAADDGLRLGSQHEHPIQRNHIVDVHPHQLFRHDHVALAHPKLCRAHLHHCIGQLARHLQHHSACCIKGCADNKQKLAVTCGGGKRRSCSGGHSRSCHNFNFRQHRRSSAGIRLEAHTHPGICRRPCPPSNQVAAACSKLWQGKGEFSPLQNARWSRQHAHPVSGADAFSPGVLLWNLCRSSCM